MTVSLKISFYNHDDDDDDEEPVKTETPHN